MATASDFNGDGRADIFWRNAISGETWLYLMNGAGISSSAAVNRVSNISWHIDAIGDFDGNGKSDVMWRNRSTGENWIYLMDGPLILSSQSLNRVSNLDWQIASDGDFNGDGKSDLLWRNKVSGENWIYLMNGASIVSSLPVNRVSNLDWQIVGDGDFDGDGNDDILWRNSKTGQIWIYLMNGAVIGTSANLTTVSNLDWRIIETGDFDGDGMADIWWRNVVSGQNWIYLMTGVAIKSSQNVNTVSNLLWQIEASADFDGDGRSDILWRNQGSGQLWQYRMNGGQILSSSPVTFVGNLDWRVTADAPRNRRSPGLFSRPGNLSCTAPDRPTGSAAIATVAAFPNLPSLDQPVGLLQLPGDASQWYVVERDGRVSRFDNMADASSLSTFIDIRGPGGPVDVDSSAVEGGLLGMAFHPDYANNRQVFLSYTVEGPSGTFPLTSRIARFTSNDGGITLDPTTEDVLISLNQRYLNHNGGHITFGPDGFLYVGFGDSGSSGDPGDRAQNTQILHGSVLRIDVDSSSPYGIPSGNPFSGNALCNAGSGTAACPEIFAWGLRNPWRFSFDSATGQLWLGDVGQDAYEEVDIVQAGGNYGWRCREGAHDFDTTGLCPPGLIDPVIEYDHNEGSSITGGFVYSGSAIPELLRRYVFADYVAGKLFASTVDALGNYGYEVLLATSNLISSFAEESNGELLYLDYAGGTIRRIIQAGGVANNTIPSDLFDTGCFSDGAPANPASGMVAYDINAAFWSDGAVKKRWFAIPDGTFVNIDVDGDWQFPIGTVLAKQFEIAGQPVETRLFMRHTDGGWGGYSYEWDVPGESATRVVGGKTSVVNGQTWIFPSESDCMACHTAAAGFSLGPEIAQMNRDFTYPPTSISANQLMTVEYIGLFSAPLGDMPENLPAIVDPAQMSADLSARARAYLHSNCANCHRPTGPTPSNMDLRQDTALNATNACDTIPLSGNLGIADARIITPGDASRSVLVNRMSRRDVHGMPPLASAITDAQGISLITAWIDDLSSCQ